MKKRIFKIGAVALLAGVWLPLAASADEALCQHKAAEIQQQLGHA